MKIVVLLRARRPFLVRRTAARVRRRLRPQQRGAAALRMLEASLH
ncbi:hypothetical protein [Brachybacterium nesterenkovii]